MKRLILALLLAIASEAIGLERFTGVSYLALQRFTERQCSDALKVYRGVRVAALSFLWSSFGDDLSCIDRFLSLPQAKKVLLIYATNETCFRRPRHCTRYDQPNFKRRAKAIAAFLEARKEDGLIMIVSTGLEDDLSSAKYLKRARILKAVLPKGTLIARNPNGKTFSARASHVVELHRKEQPMQRGAKYLFCNDGQDIDFHSRRRVCGNAASLSEMYSTLERKRRNGNSILVWWNAQGACGGKFIEPRRRDIRLYHRDLVEVNRLLKRFQ